MKNTKYEYNSLLYLISQPLFLGIGFVKIIRDLGNDYWISIILGIIIGLFINYILKMFLKKNNNIIFILINIIILLIITSSLTKCISSLYLNKTPDIVIMIPLLLIAFYSSNKNDETIFKVANIIILINAVLFLVAFISLLPLISLSNFTPVFGSSGVLNILLSSLDFALISTAPFIIFPNFKKNYNNKIYLMSTLTIIIFFILIIGTLGINVASIFNYPEYIIFKRVSFLDFFDNIQNIIFMMWIFSSFSLIGLSSLNIRKYSNKKTLLIIIVLIILISNVISNYKLFNFIFTNIRYILLSLFILLIFNKILSKFNLKK